MEKKVLELPLKSMIRECSLNPNLSFDHFSNFGLRNRENIHDTFKYKKFNNDFVSKIAIYCDEDHFLGYIKPSYDFFLESLLKILNVPIDGEYKDDEKLTNKLNARLEVLKNIRNENELKLEFPILYRDLVDGRKYFNQLQKFKGKNDFKYRDGEHYYYSCALKKNLFNFLKTQREMYTRYINDRFLLKERIENTNYNGYIRKYFDINKLAMFIAHEYLKACEVSNDRVEIKEYVKKIEMYLNNNKYDKNVKIYTDNKKEINIDTIKDRLEAIKKRINGNDSVVDWILIPKGREYRQVKKDSNVHERRTLMNNDELNKLYEVGKSRNDYYESTNYVAKVVGLGKYKGYIGYIYKNGEVILDMEFDPNRTKSTATGNAIYNLNVCDFETLSRLTKKQLQQNPKVKKLCHIGNWQEKVDKIIQRDATEIDEYNTNLLIKRLKRKALY